MKIVKFVAGLFLFASLASAQGTEAVLTGSVLDSTGAVIPQAAVTAKNLNTGVATRQTSNASGVYLFPALPPGDYTITAEKQGFKVFHSRNSPSALVTMWSRT